MTKPHRQRYGLGSFIKKFTKPIKKVFKSPLAKAALLGGGLWGLNKWGPLAGKLGLSSLGSGAGNLWKSFRGLSGGKQALLGLGALAVGTPLYQKLTKTGPYAEDDEDPTPWDIQPASIANIMGQAKDYYRNYDPYTSSLNYMSPKEFVNPSFYAAKGGVAKLANGGGVAEAQAEQMLKMEYQKYRNQGGTMSYQQFKMTVLKQAQGQGPMAQGQPRMAQPQMAAKGGRIGKDEGGLMDMGGMEKDYRQEGGFVPIGGKEKADDVPARLSKNEFVFTADAVRNAGGGDIDAGAEVMENVMKNLEGGGQISEESQGAQGMYNNMKQLETRIA